MVKQEGSIEVPSTETPLVAAAGPDSYIAAFTATLVKLVFEDPNLGPRFSTTNRDEFTPKLAAILDETIKADEHGRTALAKSLQRTHANLFPLPREWHAMCFYAGVAAGQPDISPTERHNIGIAFRFLGSFVTTPLEQPKLEPTPKIGWRN